VSDDTDLPQAADLACPEEGCGGTLTLRRGAYGLFYGCSRWPSCQCTHGAHADGRPLGVPATAAVRAARIAVHAVFDRLWRRQNAPGNKRRRARCYRALAMHLRLPVEETHIGRFTEAQCNAAVAWATWMLRFAEEEPDFLTRELGCDVFAPADGEPPEEAPPRWPPPDPAPSA